ncbi:hypothetical protein DH2020_036394 [Rehmannia glutinosa]|uniref:Uncharacterized protein n=1 Tax=Rehmannia glutinosa TaxID=99300 RepID=A0ABR0V4P0_REHGL
MALLSELVTSIVGLALKPLILAKLSCQFGARSISIIVQTWVEVLRFALCLHLIILWRLAIWAIALEMQIYRLKNELENVLWDRKELEEKLHVAIKERKMMEMMLMELEEEHDEAIVKIELLEGEVQDLKDEMQRLKEIQGKALWSYTNRAEHRDVALSRTLFSAILSLAVGLVVWEADDPCMPLVVALFTVVTMSLTSVLRLFTRIEHKPVSEVVTLLSLHWFVLGTLACPMLPRIARVL